MASTWAERTPENCDCCGHDAEDCGMLDHGFVVDHGVMAGGAVLCRECAHLLRVARLPEACVWCGHGIEEDERLAEALGWAYFADEVGTLHPCCPTCLAGTFGITARVALRRAG